MAASRSAVRERATCRSSRLCAATNLAHASSLVGASVAWINRDSSKGRTADIDAPAPVPAIGAPELGAEWPVNVQATRGTPPCNAYAFPSRFSSTPFLHAVPQGSCWYAHRRPHPRLHRVVNKIVFLETPPAILVDIDVRLRVPWERPRLAGTGYSQFAPRSRP